MKSGDRIVSTVEIRVGEPAMFVVPLGSSGKLVTDGRKPVVGVIFDCEPGTVITTYRKKIKLAPDASESVPRVE